jgi:tetratricopeptide (TPR) repeat protein
MSNHEPSALTDPNGDALASGLPSAGGPAPVTTELDYFVSRRGASATIAQEVADVLTAAGHSVLVQDHHIPHGANFVMAMHDALKRCRHFIALLSKDYDSTPFTVAEWTNFYAVAAQSGGERRFIVLRVEDCNPQGLFSAVVFGDLVGVDDTQERRARILAAAEGRAGAVARRPKLFENVPPPDLNFTGRDQLVTQLHDILVGDERAAAIRMAAIHGLGGVGKTLLAVEYVHRHAQAFGGVWWAPAQERTVLTASLAALAAKLDQRLAGEPSQERAARAGLAQLAGRSGLPFLLVYDNVEAPELLRDLVPAAGARVLVTTRWADWGGQAVEVKLDALGAEAAAAFLQKRAMRSDPAGAARLAAALGHLPLALDHAGAFCRLTRASFESYAERIDSRILRAPKGANYPASVAATFGMALEKVAAECPAAEKLIGFCAFLAPELIPLDLISDDIADEDERADAMMALSAASLIEHPNLEGDRPALTVHRLVQAAMRARLTERGEAEQTLAHVIEGLARAFPQVRFRQLDVAARRAMLLPHVLAARECLRGVGLPPSPRAGRLFCAAGRYLHARGDYVGAEPLFRDAIAVIERTFGRDHADRAMALHDLALLLLNGGHYAEAETLIPQAIEIGEKTLGQDDAEAVIRLNNLANLLRHVGRVREAEQHYRRAIAITEKINGRDHPDMAGLLNNLGNLVRGMSHYKQAEDCYREAIAIGTKAFGEHDASVGRHVHNLANLLRTRRRFDEAEPLYRQCIASLSQGLGEDYPVTARAQRNLALLLLLTKRPQEALALAEAALRAHDRAGGDAGWTRDSARTYAQALDAVGRKDEAAAVVARYRLAPKSGGKPSKPTDRESNDVGRQTLEG